jgi:hypothetical protein
VDVLYSGPDGPQTSDPSGQLRDRVTKGATGGLQAGAQFGYSLAAGDRFGEALG